jgi:hypothetical protein
MALTSCDKNEESKTSDSISSISKAPVQDVDLNKLLFEKFGLQEKTPFDDYNKEKLSDLLKYSIKISEFYNEDVSDERILLIKNSEPDAYIVIRGNLNKGELFISKCYSVNIKMDAEGMGYIKVVDNIDGEGFEASLSYGKPDVFKPIDTPIPVSLMEAKWCQRLKDETTATCYQRVVIEFCDDLVSCAALATNSGVHILILAMCSCSQK